jgi:hypothetical protein
MGNRPSLCGGGEISLAGCTIAGDIGRKGQKEINAVGLREPHKGKKVEAATESIFRSGKDQKRDIQSSMGLFQESKLYERTINWNHHGQRFDLRPCRGRAVLKKMSLLTR